MRSSLHKKFEQFKHILIFSYKITFYCRHYNMEIKIQGVNTYRVNKKFILKQLHTVTVKRTGGHSTVFKTTTPLTDRFSFGTR